MASNKRSGTVLASGFLLGITLVAGVRKLLGSTASPKPESESESEPEPEPEPHRLKTSIEPQPHTPDKLDINNFRPGPLPEPLPYQPKAEHSLPATSRSRLGQLAVFASGLAVGAVVVVGAWMTLGPAKLPTTNIPKTGISALQPLAVAPQQLTTCPLKPVAAVSGEKDGRFPIHVDVTGLIAADIGSFIVMGKEFAASGQPRDAEAALLMACRVADKLRGADSVETADAKSQLARHYANLALEGNSGAESNEATESNKSNYAELLKRAERLYSDSSQIYVAKYSANHEKSRFAAEGLAAVRQTLAQAETTRTVKSAPALQKITQEKTSIPNTEPVKLAEAESPKVSRLPAPRVSPKKDELAKLAVPASPAELNATPWPRPSFDCTQAYSLTEKMICSDAELAQLDRELGRIYARAKNATSDPAAFRRWNNEEWKMRESICRDRECLLRWYAQRREQLINDVKG